MAKKDFIPGAEKSDADRSIEALSRFADFVAKNPMVNGVLVDVEPTEDGHIPVHHGLGRRAQGAVVVGSDVGVFSSSVLSSDQQSAVLTLSSNWEILERHDVLKAETSFDFDFEANGERDYVYRVEGVWTTATGSTPYLYLRVNGLTTGMGGEGTTFRYKANTVPTATYNGVVAAFQPSSENVGIHRIELNFYSSSSAGEKRFIFCRDTMTDASAFTGSNGAHLFGKWHDEGSLVKTLGFEASVANYIAAESHFTLFRKPRLKGRQLKLWIF